MRSTTLFHKLSIERKIKSSHMKIVLLILSFMNVKGYLGVIGYLNDIR